MAREKATLQALRIGYGLVPVLAGADKFTNLLCDWEQYLSPQAAKRLPMKGSTFMKLVGLIEVGVGLSILTKWPKRGAYVCAGWLAAIAANLIADRKYDIAVRDLVMSLGAVALGNLTPAERRAISRLPARERPQAPATTGMQLNGPSAEVPAPI